MAELKVYNMKKDAVGDIELNDGVFAVEYNESLVHQVVVALHNNARQGTKSTLTRSEVRGSKKKKHSHFYPRRYHRISQRTSAAGHGYAGCLPHA